MNPHGFDRLAEEHQEHLHEAFLLAIAFGRPVIDELEVRVHLLKLVEGLLDHMAAEEETFFPWLEENLPDRTVDVKRLVDQHVHLAMQIADFEIALRRPETHPLSERLGTAKEFVKLLDVHTSLERELAMEVFERKGTLAQLANPSGT